MVLYRGKYEVVERNEYDERGVWVGSERIEGEGEI